MSEILTIYGTSMSANCRKVAAVAQELNILFTLEETDVYQGHGQAESYLSINPLGQIPSIDDDGTVICESNAILLYLANQYGDSQLYGTDSLLQAKINQWLFWESSQWQPMLADIMGALVGHKLLPALIPEPTSAPDWAADKCVKQLSFLEASLQDGWLVGADISLADFAVVAMTTYFEV